MPLEPHPLVPPPTRVLVAKALRPLGPQALRPLVLLVLRPLVLQVLRPLVLPVHQVLHLEAQDLHLGHQIPICLHLGEHLWGLQAPQLLVHLPQLLVLQQVLLLLVLQVQVSAFNPHLLLASQVQHLVAAKLLLHLLSEGRVLYLGLNQQPQHLETLPLDNHHMEANAGEVE